MSNGLPMDDGDAPEPPDVAEVVEEHRAVLERVAAADVPIAERVRRALDHLDEKEGDDD